jgi:hypothetical protein
VDVPFVTLMQGLLLCLLTAVSKEFDLRSGYFY